MTTALFDRDLQARLEATAELGLAAYGPPGRRPNGRFLWPGEQRLAAGFDRIRGHLDDEQLDAARNPHANSYGAYNPVVLFVGLSGGAQPSHLPREHEHVVGCPAMFARRPGAKGNPWFPEALQDLCMEAFGRLERLERFPWLARWRRERPVEHAVATDSSFLMLNLSPHHRPMGDDPVLGVEPATAALEKHLRAFRPAVVVAVKPEVGRFLRQAYPHLPLPGPDDEVTSADVTLGGHAARYLCMPVHPNAKGVGILRYRASRPAVATAIAEGLGGLA